MNPLFGAFMKWFSKWTSADYMILKPLLFQLIQSFRLGMQGPLFKLVILNLVILCIWFPEIAPIIPSLKISESLTPQKFDSKFQWQCHQVNGQRVYLDFGHPWWLHWATPRVCQYVLWSVLIWFLSLEKFFRCFMFKLSIWI